MSIHSDIDAAAAELDLAKRRLKKGSSRQISAAQEKEFFRSIAYSWLNTHRPSIAEKCSTLDLTIVDNGYRAIIEASHRATSRSSYETVLREIRSAFSTIRQLIPLNGESGTAVKQYTAPDFSPLAADMDMQEILQRRWKECQLCMSANAHLAATVMMGGLLEALFVAKANSMADKGPLFRAKSTPIDGQTKKQRPLKEWTLSNYVDVGHELGWITRSGRDIASVLREYRNYVHPEKERRDNVTLSAVDSDLFWIVTEQLTSQLLQSRRSK